MMKASNVNSVFLLLIGTIFLLTACSKSQDPKKSIAKTDSYTELLAERERSRPQQVITPSICGNSKNDYVYFKVANELFRYTKNSPIQIGSIFPNLNVESKWEADVNEQPKGCKDNPYVGIYIDTSQLNNAVQNDSFRGFYLFNIVSLKESPKGSYGPSTYTIENSFEYCKKSSYGFLIEETAEGLKKCTSNIDNPHYADSERPVVYVSSSSKYLNPMGKPYILSCMREVAIVCYASYAIFPDVEVKYSFFKKEINEDKIIELDKHVRALLEEMHVSK